MVGIDSGTRTDDVSLQDKTDLGGPAEARHGTARGSALLADPSDLPPIEVPARYNYVGVFLTLACNLRCPYCINHHDGQAARRRLLTGAQWLAGLRRIHTHTPLTLQGGEPSLHPDMVDVIRGLSGDFEMDLLTNLQFDIEAFSDRVDPRALRRDAPYANIRVSYHPDQMDLLDTVDRVNDLLARGFDVGLFMVDHPDWVAEREQARQACEHRGIDFRTKEFLGRHNNRLYGTYLHPDAVGGRARSCRCRTSELLIDPSGAIFRCHRDLYRGQNAIGHLLDPDFQIDDVFRPCSVFGECNPCDVKVKTNRFQQFGHTAVEIEGIDDLVESSTSKRG